MGPGMEVTGCVSHRGIMPHEARIDHCELVDFSSVLTKGQIEDMATADEFEVVKEVQVSRLPRSSAAGEQARRT